MTKKTEKAKSTKRTTTPKAEGTAKTSASKKKSAAKAEGVAAAVVKVEVEKVVAAKPVEKAVAPVAKVEAVRPVEKAAAPVEKAVAPARKLSAAEVEGLVRREAFRLAQRRNFRGGSAVQDWFAAEQFVKSQLAARGITLAS